MPIDTEELTDIDLDALGAYPDHSLKAYFYVLAMRASLGQLRAVLGLPVSDPTDDIATLAEAYSSGKAATAIRLRGLLRS